MLRTSVVRRVLAVSVLLLASGACGAQTEPSDRANRVETPVTIVDGEVQISCGGPPGWSPSQMLEGISTSRSHDELADALAHGADSFGPMARDFFPEGRDTPWRLLAESDGRLTFGLGEWTVDGPAAGAHYFTVQSRGESWDFAGSGDCQLRPLLKTGVSWAEVTAEGALDRGASVLTVGVHERDCTGSRDPSPFLRDPVLVQTDESVIVYWTSTPPEGGNSCPGNPTVSRELSLDAPLGDRPLLDGSRWPPTPIGS